MDHDQLSQEELKNDGEDKVPLRPTEHGEKLSTAEPVEPLQLVAWHSGLVGPSCLRCVEKCHDYITIKVPLTMVDLYLMRLS